ncbi:hypothetical protein PENSPDRAFT_269065 [Peniophora sp. CONT]|nr:hypothetical protein PENSPDRAFT_269065 [Peniophora sp. CONT]
MATLALRSSSRFAPRALVRAYATGPERVKPRMPDPLADPAHASTSALPDGDLTFIHRPPPSLPSVHSYTSNPASPLLRPASDAPADTPLPPPLRDIKAPGARLTDAQVQEMRSLRKQDPTKYTQKKLGEMFGVSASTVGLIATLSQSQRTKARKEFFGEHEKVRERWGERTTTVREMRKKRREFW